MTSGMVAYNNHFLTIFLQGLVALKISRIKLEMAVVVKALLSFYKIELLPFHEAQNAKELCIFRNAVSSTCYPLTLFFTTNIDHVGLGCWTW